MGDSNHLNQIDFHFYFWLKQNIYIYIEHFESNKTY